MKRKLAICGIKQNRQAKHLNTSAEVAEREIVSLYHEILELEAKKLRENEGMARQVHNGNNLREQKVFYFTDVRVREDDSSVVVQFEDGHKETFEDAELVTAYRTRKLSDHGPTAAGVVRNEEGTVDGTVHFVDEDKRPVCGGVSSLTEEVVPFRPKKDNLDVMRPVCGNCKSRYDHDFIDTLIQLRITPEEMTPS